MGDIILMIFEGKRTEPHISDNMKNIFFNKNSIIHAIWGCSIYSLYEKIKEDEDIGILQLLKEKGELEINTKINKISQIYMFFDSEGKGRTKYNNEKLKEMLEKFNNETAQGKLYISYPMVEALKHSKKDLSVECLSENELKCVWNLRNKESYKEFIDRITDYTNTGLLTLTDWNQLISINVQKAYCLVYGKWKIPEYKEVSALHQIKILEHQEKFIVKKNSLVSLSAFPFFILNYFGESFYKNLQLNEIKCKFKCIVGNH